MASFLHAPRQAIDKLNKEVVIEMCQMSIESTLQVAEEERRAGVIKEELVMLRAVLPKMATSMGRSKRAAKSNGMNGENMPLCSDTSPSLLGPLLVNQSPTTIDKVDFGLHQWNSYLIFNYLKLEVYIGCGHSGRLWALRACLITSFTPFGRSGRVTHASVQ